MVTPVPLGERLEKGISGSALVEYMAIEPAVGFDLSLVQFAGMPLH